jgi:hypothetical protein
MLIGYLDYSEDQPIQPPSPRQGDGH